MNIEEQQSSILRIRSSRERYVLQNNAATQGMLLTLYWLHTLPPVSSELVKIASFVNIADMPDFGICVDEQVLSMKIFKYELY